MAGGAMIRGMARLMGAVTVGTTAAAPTSSDAFCHVSTPSSQEHMNILSALNLPQKEPCSSSPAVPSKPLMDVQYVDMEDWEYPSEKECSHNHLVFAPVPSEEEVEEATEELHAALHLSVPAACPVLEESRPEPMPYDEQVKFVPAAVDQEKAVNKKLSSLSTQLGRLVAGSSSAYFAFQLLQTNAKAQDAVKSLARDPAVWRAVLSNEKVLELTQALQDEDGCCVRAETSGQKKSTCSKDDEDINILNLTSKVCDFVTGKVLQILDKVVEIIGSVFTSVEKTFFSKECTSTMDKTVASCTMLAVAVLLVVVVKRVAIK